MELIENIALIIIGGGMLILTMKIYMMNLKENKINVGIYSFILLVCAICVILLPFFRMEVEKISKHINEETKEVCII